MSNNIYRSWEHYVGRYNLRGVEMTMGMLLDWSQSGSPQLECIYCSQLYDYDTRYCPSCGEYKGLQPFIMEFSDCVEVH